MLKVQYIRTRSNTDISFFSPIMPYLDHDPNAFIPHWWDQYRNTGELIHLEQTLSEDSLTQYSTMLWEYKEIYDQAMLDPIVIKYYEALYDYNEKNNIINEGPIFTEM
jgi:hypothetical protein